MKLLLGFEWRRKFSVPLSFLLIAIIGLLDFATGYEYAFSLFYVFPIVLVTWYSTSKLGFVACSISAIIWLVADKSTGHLYSNNFIPYWNTFIRFSFFVIITYLLSILKGALQREKDLSLTDYLTGASNSRHFYKIVQMEINRLERSQRPFTIAYLDVDNFKVINDAFGHAEGDLVLKAIVSLLKSETRNTDLVARLGGDELALFFPDTNQEAAQIILSKIQDSLINKVAKDNKTVTFSIGVVTCLIAPPTVDELIRTADKLMYSVKHNGKNKVQYAVYRLKEPGKANNGLIART